VLLATFAAPGIAFAHDGLGETALQEWTWEPFTIALLILSALVYAIGLRVLWVRAGLGRGIRVWQAAAFATGLLSLAVALISPVAWLSEILFSVHMTQHEILMLISAPLLVFGHPLLAALWAAPMRWREAAGRWAARPSVSSTWHALTAPVVVFVLHAAALWVWHIPVLYEAALRREGIHALEHLSYVVTAALFWWAMVEGRYGRIGYGLAVLYVFLTAVHSSALGALLVVSPGLLYPSYGAAAAVWHVDALEDQQLAGLLMWVPFGLVFIVFGLALLAAWLGEAERRVRLGSTGPAAVRRPDLPPPREALRRTAEALAKAGQVGRSGISDA
jgi:putative membrane protein